MNGSTASAIGLILVPGIFAWWTGWRLTRLAEHPALSERLLARNQRVTQLTIAAIIVILTFVRHHAGWAVPSIFLAVAVASFPARRRLLDEHWSLGQYLFFHVRLWAGWFGLSLLVMVTPFVVGTGAAARWEVAAGLAALLLAWNAAYSRMFARLVGARPMLMPPRLAGIAAQASITTPKFFRFGSDDGGVVNAFALPSVLRPGVAFTGALMKALDADEQAAVFAHEVAHLEYFNRRRLVTSSATMSVLILLATIGAAVVPAQYWSLLTIWPVVMLIVFTSTLARRKVLEEESDRRAIALCGDPEALVHALVKITTVARLPRRWGLDFERGATHPSLARRIQAIRGTAGAAGIRPLSQVVATKSPGTYVILGANHATWLEGVPAGTPPEAGALRAAAVSARSVRYDGLMELRLKAGVTGSPVLTATDLSGKSWSVPVREEDVGAVQAALDVVDVRFGRAPVASATYAVLGRVLSVLLMLLGVGVGMRFTPMVTGLLGFWRPNKATLAASAAAAIGTAAAAMTFLGPLLTSVVASGVGWRYLGSVVGLLAVGGLSAWLAVKRAPALLERRADVILPVVVLGCLTLGVWILLAVNLSSSLGLAVVDDTVKGVADTWLAPLALACALLAARHRAVRWGGTVMIAVSLLLFVLGWVGVPSP